MELQETGQFVQNMDLGSGAWGFLEKWSSAQQMDPWRKPFQRGRYWYASKGKNNRWYYNIHPRNRHFWICISNDCFPVGRIWSSDLRQVRTTVAEDKSHVGYPVAMTSPTTGQESEHPPSFWSSQRALLRDHSSVCTIRICSCAHRKYQHHLVHRSDEKWLWDLEELSPEKRGLGELITL